MKTTRLLLLLIPFFFSSVGLHAQSNLDWWKITTYGKLGGPYQEITATGQSVDPNGNVIVTGTFKDSATFYNEHVSGFGGNDIFISKFDSSGNLKWVQTIGGSDYDASGCIYTDDSGYIYTGGFCVLPAQFGNVSVGGKGNCVFITKMDTKGNILWVKTFHNSYEGGVSNIKTDNSGNIYAAGSFVDSIHFDSSSYISKGGSNIFLAKLDANGNLKWVKNAGYNSPADATGMDIDDYGNVYLTGVIGPYAYFDNIQVLKQAYGSQIFVAKYRSDGKLFKVWNAIGNGWSSGNDIILVGNRLIVTGELDDDSIYFDKTFFNYTGKKSDAFVASFDTSLNLQWVKAWGGWDSEKGLKLAYFPKTKEVFMAGSFTDTTTFDKNVLIGSGHSNFLVAFRPENGQLDWLRTVSSDLSVSQIGGIGTYNSKYIFLTLSADWTNVSLYKYHMGVNITGAVYDDENKNGIQDANERGIAYSAVKITPGNYIVYSNKDGRYNAYVDTGTVKIAPILPRFCYASSPSSHTSVFGSFNSVPDTADFGLQIPRYKDLSICVTNENRLRPGRTVNYNIAFKNTGTLPQYNCRLSFLPDSVLTYSASAPNFTNKSGDTLVWNIDTLEPGEQWIYKASFTIHTTAKAGNNALSSAMIFPVKNDTLPIDNYDTAITEVVNSYDPNEKSVVESNGQLTYTIHFQNTGTDTAFLIVVKDTLDANLNPETFTMISSSSPCTYTIKNSVLECRFENVNLPENKVNEEGSQGFFRYSLSPYPKLPFGTSISNTASIFFDYNTPVSTNTVVSTLNKTTGIEQYQKVNGAITVYPNPFNEYTTIVLPENAGSYSYALYNDLGKQVEFKSNLNGKQFQLNKNGHASGIYLLRVLDADQKEIGTMKVIMK